MKCFLICKSVYLLSARCYCFRYIAMVAIGRPKCMMNVLWHCFLINKSIMSIIENQGTKRERINLSLAKVMHFTQFIRTKASTSIPLCRHINIICMRAWTGKSQKEKVHYGEKEREREIVGEMKRG